MLAGCDDLNIYASLKTALKVLVEMRQQLGEDAKLSFNMNKVKIYIPGVTRERARELVLQDINHDNLLESLRELYEQDLAKPELDIITVTGLKCVGVPIGTPEFVNVFVLSDAPATDAPAQGHDDKSALPLSLPPINLLASLHVLQDEDNGKVSACP